MSAEPSPLKDAIMDAAANKHGMPIVELVKAYDALEAERDRAYAYAEAAPHPGSAPWKEMRAVYAERDRLRDIVRRLCDELESHYYEPQSMNDRSVIREARAALGEAAP